MSLQEVLADERVKGELHLEQVVVLLQVAQLSIPQLKAQVVPPLEAMYPVWQKLQRLLVRQTWQLATLQTVRQDLASVASSKPALQALQVVLVAQVLQLAMEARQFWTHDLLSDDIVVMLLQVAQRIVV